MPDPTKALQQKQRPAIPVPSRQSHPWPSPVAPLTTQQFAPELLDVASRPGAPESPLAWDTREPSWLQRGGPSEQRARVASQEGVTAPSALQVDDIRDLPHLAMAPVKMMKHGGLAALGAGALARRLAQMEERQATEEALQNVPDFMAYRAPHAVPAETPLPPLPKPGYPRTARGWDAWRQGGHNAVIDQWERDQRIQKWLGGEGGPATAGPPRLALDLPSAEMTPESIAPLPPLPQTPVPPTPAGPVPTTNPGRVRKRTP